MPATESDRQGTRVLDYAIEDRSTEARESPTIKRRLIAMAFADVAGFSRLIALNDVETVRRWKAVRSEIIEPLMKRHGGRIAEVAGDALLIEFSSVVDAVQWATTLQRMQHDRQDPADRYAIRLRIGINVDDVIDDDGILQGDGVNIAARIHQAAEPGQIVVTGRVRDYLANRPPYRFRDLGTPPMKNIVQPVRVYALEWIDDAESQPAPQPHLQWLSRPTVAVLPFRNVGGSEDDAYFGEGITEAIITALARSRSLYVIARNSTLRYSVRGSNANLRQIAGELDVRYLLDGSVWRHGNKLRIRVELVDVTDQRQVWSQRFDGSGEDIFDFQDRISSRIIGSLEPHVRAIESIRVATRPTESLDAYDCVLKALSCLYRFTDDSFRDSALLLERAIALDPAYAQAHAYYAWRLNFVVGEGRSVDLAGDQARAIQAATRSLELDDEDPFVLGVAAHSFAFHSKQLDRANELYDRALELSENSAFAWGMSALTQAYVGNGDKALERLENFWRLNPDDPLAFYFHIVAGIAEFVAGRYPEAISWTRRSLRASPRFLPALRTLAASLALSGDIDAARAMGKRLLVVDPSFRITTFIGWYPLQRAEDLARLRAGLQAAGLPE